MRKSFKTILIWVFLFASFFLIFSVLKNKNSQHLPVYEYADFLTDLEENHVAGLRINESEITVDTYGQYTYRVYGTIDNPAYEKLAAQGVHIDYGPPKDPWYNKIIINLIPLIIILALIIYFIRKSQAKNGGMFGLRNSTVREVEGDTGIRFSDVAGCEEAKAALKDIVDFLKNSKVWLDIGARLPRGVLLEGPSGCGKTLLARAVAGETSAKFFEVSASEFVEMFVGVGAARVRDTFEQAQKNLPAVIFIDEIDTLGRRRGSGLGPGHDEREQTLNQLLVCLDGFQANDQIVVIAATNRADMLDSALMRPGRFDRKIHVPAFTPEDRKAALAIHTQNKSLAEEINLDRLVELTDGYNGAEIENLSNEAAMYAVRRLTSNGNAKKALIEMQDFLKALDTTDEEKGHFDVLDKTLVESFSKFTEPQGDNFVHVVLDDQKELKGKIIWADACFIKLLDSDKATHVVLKQKIHSLKALDGTDKVARADISTDPWSNRMPGTG